MRKLNYIFGFNIMSETYHIDDDNKILTFYKCISIAIKKRAECGDFIEIYPVAHTDTAKPYMEGENVENYIIINNPITVDILEQRRIIKLLFNNVSYILPYIINIITNLNTCIIFEDKKLKFIFDTFVYKFDILTENIKDAAEVEFGDIGKFIECAKKLCENTKDIDENEE